MPNIAEIGAHLKNVAQGQRCSQAAAQIQAQPARASSANSQPIDSKKHMQLEVNALAAWVRPM